MNNSLCGSHLNKFLVFKFKKYLKHLMNCDAKDEGIIKFSPSLHLYILYPSVPLKYSQVQRVEEKNEVFALEVSQTQVLELPVVDSCGLKVRSRLSDGRGPSGGA